MDTTNSTKTVGFVLWEYFFDNWAAAEIISVPDAASANSYIHACYFTWQAIQWGANLGPNSDETVTERYALTVLQNCHASLITKFTFTL